METKANWAGAVVVTHDGKRLGWKTTRGADPQAMARQLSMKYFQPFGQSSCEIHHARFDGDDCFEQAAAWARSFQRHPQATGFEP